MSEVVHNFFPKMVDLHHYSKTNSVDKKKYNWKHLNQRVFKAMGFTIPETDIIAVCNCARGAIEDVLELVQHELAAYQERTKGVIPEKKVYSFHKPTASSKSRVNEVEDNAKDFFSPTTFAKRSSSRSSSRSNSRGPSRARSMPATPRNGRTPRSRSGISTPRQGNLKSKRTGRSRENRSQTQVHSRQRSRDISPIRERGSGSGSDRSSASSGSGRMGNGVLLKKDEVIKDLNNTVQILNGKVSRLEHLLKLKDQHIENLQTRLSEVESQALELSERLSEGPGETY